MNKYHNIPTVVDGIRFSSKKEARRYQELKLLEKAGVISNLELQPRFEFEINDKLLKYSSGRKVTYFADFRYTELITLHSDFGGAYSHQDIIEDVKGIQTPVFKLKAALMLAVHGIKVRIT